LVGNIRLQGYALMNRSAAMVDLGLHRDAGPILEEAKRFVQILEERSTIALLQITEGQLEMGLGRWNRAVRLWERGLHDLKEVGDLADYALSLTYVGRFYLDRGDVEQTRKILAEADVIARRLGGTSLIATIEGLLRRVDSEGVTPATSSRHET